MKHLNLLTIIASFTLLCSACIQKSGQLSQEKANDLPTSQLISDQTAHDMVAAANALLEGLPPNLKKVAQHPFNDEEREKWDFFPLPTRDGARLTDMSKTAQELTFNLLKTGLSEEGYETVRSIMQLEEVLLEMENRTLEEDIRHPTKYYLSIFGTPSTEEAWGWKYEGHHVSLNYTSLSGALSVTPAFLGTNPAEVPIGKDKGKRVLGEYEDAGRAFLLSLTEEQQQQAIVSDEAYLEVLTGRESVAKIDKFEGLSFNDMTVVQQEQFIGLIKQLINILKPTIVEQKWQEMEAQGLDNFYFTWTGGTQLGEKHYYRIHGPKTIIEYDNAQNDGNHAHYVWRDTENDFGRDFLKEHHLKHKH